MNELMFLIIILAVGLLVLMVISQKPKSKQSKAKKHRIQTGPMDREFIARKWQTVELLSQKGGSGLRDAVSEADKLLDYALKHSGVRGDTMGERLKNSGQRFSNINAVWSAHKVRNALAHEADFDLVPSQAREAIQGFKQGLHDLGAL